MDLEPDGLRRMLSETERLGAEMGDVYQSLTELQARYAPGWRGDSARHFGEIMGRYAEAHSVLRADLERLGARMRHAIAKSEEVEALFG